MATRDINGAAVRAIRELVGINQPELARRCGVGQPYISHIERGSRNASPMVIRRIADALGVPLDSITKIPSAAEPKPAEVA